MKRIPSLLLSLALSLALLVPVLAADACKETSYIYFFCGKEMRITEHHCRNGDNTIRVESEDGYSVSHLDAATQTITLEQNANGETITLQISLLSPEGSKLLAYHHS